MLTWLNNLTEGFEDRLRRNTLVDAQSLGFFRILFGIFMMLFYWPSYRWISAAPDTFFNPFPLSLTALLSGFPPPGFLVILDYGIVFFVVTLTVGVYTRVSTLGLFLLILAGTHFNYSFGKIDHTTVMPLALLLIMLFKDWGRYLSIDSLWRKSGEEEAPLYSLGLLALILAFGFFTAGYAKAINWIDFDMSANGFQSWLYNGVYRGKNQFLLPYLAQLNAPWFFELADYSAALFEVTFLPALLWRRTWYIWLGLVCLFHLANVVLLNIAFHINAIVYLAFVPWSQLAPVRRLFSLEPKKIFMFLVPFSLLAVAAKLVTNTYGIGFSLGGDYNRMVLVIWTLTGVIMALTLKHKWREAL